MANMIKDLLAPDQAKLLDDQLRRKQLQEGVTNYGNDAMGKFLTAASGAQRASAGFGMAAERAIGGRQAGPNEAIAVQNQQKVQAQKIKQVNDAKLNALFALDNNTSFKKGSKEYEQRKKLIQTTASVPQLEAMAKFYAPKNQASPSVKVLEDGSAISVGPDNRVTQLRPQALYGFLSRSQKDLEENFSSDSRALAQQVYLDGRKAIENGQKTEAQVRAEVNKALQPNLNDMIVERVSREQELATGYADFETNLDRTVQALDNANVGTFGDIRQTFAKVYQAVFGEDIASVKDTELVSRVLNKEVLNSAQFMKGALSNADMEFLKQSVGTTGTSLEGLKEALVELAARKKVAYDVLKDFNTLDNRAKNSFDFEGAKLDKQTKIKESYYNRFGLKSTARRSDSRVVPSMLDRNSGTVIEVGPQDAVDFFSLPKTKN